ncbi:MAG: pyridoxal-phosphate dependent enzyme [Deltaproteobacteria bacterium]|nr:pyridoxal-phosphate dependent enzyme [Candidatus Zymogenaceae bacterium]
MPQIGKGIPMTNPLFSAFPGLSDKIPHCDFGTYPTPVERLTGLEKELGLTNLFIKRDDKSSDVYGGNKVRKLEFILGEAVKRKAAHTVAFGYAGSNFTLAAAVFAKRVGISPVSMHLPQPNAAYVRKNLLYQKLIGAELHELPNTAAVTLGTLAICGRCLVTTGRFPYIIAAGGSSAVGVVGGMSGMFELKEQIDRGLLPTPDVIYVTIGSSGTAASLALGVRALGLPTLVRAVRVSDLAYASFKISKELADGAARILGRHEPSFRDMEITTDNLQVVHGYLGDGYARFSRQGMAALGLVKKTDGIDLDGTYTGKTAAAMIDDARSGLLKGKTVLFWNSYNSVNIEKKIKGIDYRTLPKRYHRYFETPYQPLEIVDRASPKV